MATAKLTADLIKSLPKESGFTWDTATPALGINVGKNRRTFVYFARMKGEVTKKKIKIGVYGEPHPEGGKWTVKLARLAAEKVKGQLAEGIDPTGKSMPSKPKPTGPTLQDALDVHVHNMRMLERSARSIASMEDAMKRHLKDWLPKPIAELTTPELKNIYAGILANTKVRANAVNPPGVAIGARLVVHVGSCWQSLNEHLQGALALKSGNPAAGVKTRAVKPRTVRLGGTGANDMSFPEWHRRVWTLSGVRRDFQLIALFTGIRAEGIQNLRWDDIDEATGLLHVRIAKGGKPYQVPLCATHREIFARRCAENPKLNLFDGYTDDSGWVFPTRSRSAPFRVIPIAESKEWRTDEEGVRSQFLPQIHSARRTYISIATELGVDDSTVKTLANHKIAGITARNYVQLENFERYSKAQSMIEATLLARLKTKNKSHTLKAV